MANNELSIANSILFEKKSFTAKKRFRLAKEREMTGKYLPALIIISSRWTNTPIFVESDIEVIIVSISVLFSHSQRFLSYSNYFFLRPFIIFPVI